MHVGLRFNEKSTTIEHVKNFSLQLAKDGAMLYQIGGFLHEHT